MTVSSTPYKKRKEPKNIVAIPPPPNIPEPHPERPPPHVPIPGEPTPGGQQKQLYKCAICGAVFNSKEELDLHMSTDHARGRRAKNQAK